MVGRVKLCVSEPEYGNTTFYGNVKKKRYAIEETEFEKFVNVNHPNKGVCASFNDPNGNNCTIEITKYAWEEVGFGDFEAIICDDTYMYEIDILCDEHGKVLKDQTLSVNLYDISDPDVLIDSMEVTEWHTIAK